jgi:uncharacterized protein (TIGR02996 family)
MGGAVLLEVDPDSLEGAERPLPEAGLTAGRVRDNGLVIDSHRAARRHFRLTAEGGQWWVEDLKSPSGTLLNGRRLGLREPLAQNDVISLVNQRDPYWLFQQRSPARNPELERAIAEHDRREDWLVYGDWLQQEGDPLGRAVIETSAPGAAPWAAVEDTPQPVRRLKLEWQYGFWRSAEVSGEGLSYAWPAYLAMVLHWPQGRFLRELRVDLYRYLRDADGQARWLRRMLELAPETLTHLELGAGFSASAWSEEELRRRLPRWDGQSPVRWTS